MNSFIKLFLFSLCIQKAISNDEGSLKAEGNSESYETRIKKSILKNMAFKWTFPIDYKIGPNLDRDTIKAALALLEKETCITFNETSTFTKGGLNYIYDKKCFSFVGKATTTIPQNIGLAPECNKVTIVLHETSHALGVIHEMTRHDRDYYVDVKFVNIHPPTHPNFKIFDLTKASPLGLTYDFGSVMHYDRYAGTINRQLTMQPKYESYLKTIGQRTRFGFNDAKQ
uniref:Metalloendopeptidase n=1 Tax=Strongyloides papillosus TaxID=174720 RepID=A0A0N5BI36_STREA